MVVKFKIYDNPYMNKKQNHELIDNENPEWTAQNIKNAIQFSDLPASLRNKLSVDVALKEWLQNHSPA